MSKNETIINFRYNRSQWHVIRLTASRLMCSTETGEIRQCTGSDIIRELLDEWIGEHAIEWFPKLLKDFQKQGVQNKTTEYMTEVLMEYAESATINSAPNAKLEDLTPEQLRIRKESLQELADLKESMMKAGFTETEYNTLIKGKAQK